MSRNPKIYLFGEKFSGVKPRGDIQVYEELKKQHLQQGTLFEDPQFVPGKIDLGEQLNNAVVQWLRPKEIVANPHFAINGKRKCDINQGELGDCWFLAALADITQDEELIDIVVPPGQSCIDNYAGIFHFRFWRYGNWIDVVIDDRLPTQNGKLVFLRELPNTDEFWAALTEKAFAKLYGSYKKIEGGLISEALVQMTGGLNETYFNISLNKKINYLSVMEIAFKKDSYLGCGITINNNEKRSDGLVAGHAYSILDKKSIRIANETHNLLKLRNPWGQHEWNGDWSDRSSLWNTIPANIKQQLLTVKDDGEFWMGYHDFVKKFDYLDICHKNPDFFRKDDSSRWKTYITNCAWVRGVNNGGGPNSAGFSLNPQFILKINGPQKSQRYRVIVAVMQKFRREQGLQNLNMGIAIYKLNTGALTGRLDSSAFRKENIFNFWTPEYQQQVTGHVDLPNGTYCLVPFTTDVEEYCSFLLRVYAEIDFDLGEQDDNVTILESNEYPTNTSFNIKSDAPGLTNAVNKIFTSKGKQEISWIDLKAILDELVKSEGKQFSEEICKSMLAMADTTMSGKLNYHEFYGLWNIIGIWRGIFKLYDKDNSKGISAAELKDALKKARINVNNRILQILLLRYGNENGKLEMEDFLECCIKLNHMIALYEAKGIKEVELTDWLANILYS